MKNHKTKIPLVLLSGLLCDQYVWRSVAERLGDIAEVSILSFAGYSHISTMADYVLSNAPSSFALAGHSMGGRVAIEAYKKHPQRISRLALLNTGVHPVKDSERPSRQRLLDLSKQAGMRAVAETWLPPMMGTQEQNNPSLMGELEAMVLRNTADDFQGQIQSLLNRPNAEAVLPSISIPTLLLSGSDDAWSPVSQLKDIQQQITNSTFIEIENSGHMSTVEKPNEVALALRDWLS